MLLILGILIVIGATVGGFMIAGGHPLVLLHISEFIIIGGVALGILVVSSPIEIMRSVLKKFFAAVHGTASRKGDYVALLEMLYEVLVIARRNGLIALEDHVLDPAKSALFKKYPSFLQEKDRVAFLCNGLKPLIDGRIKPEQLHGMLHAEVEAKVEQSEAPVHVLQLVGDSLPGVGIIAAVLGIINTMAAIADGPEAVGEKVAAALTGTFLGVLGAYGFVNPVTSRVRYNNTLEIQYFTAIVKALSGFASGMAPVMAVEVARRCLDSSIQPDAEDLERRLKAITAKEKKPNS